MDLRDPLKERLLASRILWPICGLAALLLFNLGADLLAGTNFYGFEIRDGHLYGTIIDILNHGSKVMLLAIGMTLVMATGGIDLSVGSVMSISGALAALLVTTTRLPIGLVLAAALGACLLAGLWNGLLVALLRVQPIVATLILMVAGRGLAMLLTDGQIVTFEHRGLVYIGNGHFLGLPFTTTIVVVVFAATLLLTRRTAVGLFIEAVGDNDVASRFSGVNGPVIKILAYGYCGFCAGVAGLIAASNIKAADVSRAGEFMELDAIFAVIVGGTAFTGGRFTLVGSLVGALVIQTLTTTMYNMGVRPAVAPVPKAIVVIVVCLLQSADFRRHVAGLFRRAPA